MAAAALRPSEMAQTTSDWPRRISPAAKMPSTEVMVAVVSGHVAAIVEGQPNCSIMPERTGPEEAHGQQDQIGVEGEFGTGDGTRTWAEARRAPGATA
jgi:hypothetical protein